IEFGIHENQFKFEEDFIFSSTEWDHDFNLGEYTIHPFDNKNAKWSLETLFVSNLESSLFLGTDHIFTDMK
ncbi:11655_t:CDS:1, partial [Scutellospora calospora]